MTNFTGQKLMLQMSGRIVPDDVLYGAQVEHDDVRHRADEILDTIRETTTVREDILAALEDGDALAAIGVTDADTTAVEHAAELVRRHTA